jgi:cytochrome c556
VSGEDVIEWSEVERSLEWMKGIIERTERERDQYRDWFERLTASTAEYIAIVEAHDCAAGARAAKALKADLDAARARQLKADGYSAAQIGVTLRPEKPYDAAHVRRLLRRPQRT